MDELNDGQLNEEEYELSYSEGKVELKNFIVTSLMKSDSANFRDVDSAIDYIANLFESLGEMITLLYEKKILDINDIKRITNNRKIKTFD